jgi:hypothetical protein
MLDDAQGYRAYLVRLWQTRSRGQVVWRASVQDAHSSERDAFADLEALFAFLEEKTGGRTRREAKAGDTAAPTRAQTWRESDKPRTE